MARHEGQIPQEPLIQIIMDREKLAELGNVVFDATSFRGQTMASAEKYGDAIRACMQLDYLPFSIAQIARIYHLPPANLRDQLRRHFPDVVAQRNAYRNNIGFK